MQTPEINSTEFSAVKHPTREQWMEYLYGEMPRSAAAAVRAHLRACADCQAQYGAFAHTKARLNDWSLARPPGPSEEVLAFPRAARWAMAALLVLGLGYGIGRVSAPTVTPAAMRAAIEPALRSALLGQLRQQIEQDTRGDWLAAVGGSEEALNTPLRRQLRERLDEWKAQAITTGTTETRRLVLGLAEQFRVDRQQDQQSVLALFEQAERKHQAEHLRLRRDVETVAVVADDQLKRTESRLGQLASYTEAKLTYDSSPETIEPLNLRNTKGND